MMNKIFFTTTALPYSNGSLHMGHLMEYIQADVWIRNIKMCGYDVYFICSDDAHGTPITLNAKKVNTKPELIVNKYSYDRPVCLDGFDINFDHWYSTNSPENIFFSRKIFQYLTNKKLIKSKNIKQFYDLVEDIFLSDRYIRGNCPNCKKFNKSVDMCEFCGSIYSHSDLVKPYSTLSKSKPLLKSSKHYFFEISNKICVNFLKNWTKKSFFNDINILQKEIYFKIKEWLNFGKKKINIKDWDISRDFPYFGIEIPRHSKKYLYVWLDAPIGYLSSLKSFCYKNKINFGTILNNKKVYQMHFIGKDIVYFHYLFLPALFYFSRYRIPDKIHVHGFMNLDNKKMSKNKNYGIRPLKYLSLNIDKNYIRYYISSKLNNKIEDVDFNKKDFLGKVNSDLVGKYINLASRSFKFINKYFNGKLYFLGGKKNMIRLNLILSKKIRYQLSSLNFGNAIKEIMKYNDITNKKFEKSKPWLIAKGLKKKKNSYILHDICSRAISNFKSISVMLHPIIPNLTNNIKKNLFKRSTCSKYSWKDIKIIPVEINKFKHLIKRIEYKEINKLLNDSLEEY